MRTAREWAMDLLFVSGVAAVLALANMAVGWVNTWVGGR